MTASTRDEVTTGDPRPSFEEAFERILVKTVDEVCDAAIEACCQIVIAHLGNEMSAEVICHRMRRLKAHQEEDS